MKLRRYTELLKYRIHGCLHPADDEHAIAGWSHWCPGCNSAHEIAVERPFRNGASWTFDGNMDAPTFAPSVNIRIGPMPTVPAGRPDAGRIRVCHYFIRAGMIEFCSDSTHELAGKTVPLPDWPSSED